MAFKRSRVRSSSSPPKNTKSSDLVFFIQADRLGISSPSGVYHQHGKAVLHLITPSGVYFCRLDDIQDFVLMICNFFEIDDIHGYAVILPTFSSLWWGKNNRAEFVGSARGLLYLVEK